MRHSRLLCLLLTTTLITSSANAAPLLLAIGDLNGSTDLSGLSGLMENGLPGNVFGGLGSGLAHVSGSTFLATPDRGPNATPYNAAVDNTTSYISRFQTLNLNLTANAGPGLPYTLTPTLVKTTLLSSPTPLAYGTGAGLGNKIDGVTPIGSGAPSRTRRTPIISPAARTTSTPPRTPTIRPTAASIRELHSRFDRRQERVRL